MAARCWVVLWVLTVVFSFWVAIAQEIDCDCEGWSVQVQSLPFVPAIYSVFFFFFFFFQFARM